MPSELQRESWPWIQEDESTKTGQSSKQRRHFDLIEERKKQTYSTWHSIKGEGQADAFLGKEQMEGKLSKVEKHHCGCSTKTSKAMVSLEPEIWKVRKIEIALQGTQSFNVPSNDSNEGLANSLSVSEMSKGTVRHLNL